MTAHAKSVVGNVIGTNAASDAASLNSMQGIYRTGANNTIGGIIAADRHVAAGHGRIGDYVEAEGVKENESLFYADEIGVTRNGRPVQ